MLSSKYINKSLEEIEQVYWGEVPPNSSYLVSTCYALRKKKLLDYTAEDLRIMIGQKEGLEYLIPLAIGVLKADPFTEGRLYEGVSIAKRFKV